MLTEMKLKCNEKFLALKTFFRKEQISLPEPESFQFLDVTFGDLNFSFFLIYSLLWIEKTPNLQKSDKS